MARLIAKMGLTLGDLNLNDLLEFGPFTLERGVDVTYRGTVYRDVFHGNDDDGRTIYFGGEDFAMSGGVPGGGRLQAITIEDAAERDVFSLTGFDVGVGQVADLMATPRFKDDRAFFADLFAGADTFKLSDHADNLRGFGGNDRMMGNGGRDILAGDGGRDRLFGGGDDDRLSGGKGSDVLNGGAQFDILFGGAGNDVLNGGLDTDTLVGGRGADTFVFGRDGHVDRVRDFEAGIDTLWVKGTSDRKVGDLVTWQDGNWLCMAYESGQIRLKGYTQDDIQSSWFDFS